MIPYIDIHTHRGERTVIVCGERELLCRGIHPWNVGKATMAMLNEVVEAAAGGEIVAIGEIGLDYATEIDHELQKFVFEAQLALAERHDLPVVVHCVHAMDDALSILADHSLRAVIFHGFIGPPQVARGAVERGYWLSFGPTAFRSPKTLEALRSAPPGQFFLETDTSGERIETVYTRAAEALGTRTEALREQLYDNFKRIFG